MEDKRAPIRARVLVIRIFLGVLFAFLLVRLFRPSLGVVSILAVAGLLVFFSYIFERIHKKGKP